MSNKFEYELKKAFSKYLFVWHLKIKRGIKITTNRLASNPMIATEQMDNHLSSHVLLSRFEFILLQWKPVIQSKEEREREREDDT